MDKRTVAIMERIEEFFDNKGIKIPCSDKYEELHRNLHDNDAKIYGTEYGNLMDDIANALENFPSIGKTYIQLQEEKKKFQKKCYSLYQLEWMKDHGYTLQDLFDTFATFYAGALDGGFITEDTDPYEDMDGIVDTFYEIGFHGMEEVFACENEFYDNEYCEPEVMEELLGNNSDMYAQYLLFGSLEKFFRIATESIIYKLENLLEEKNICLSLYFYGADKDCNCKFTRICGIEYRELFELIINVL